MIHSIPSARLPVAQYNHADASVRSQHATPRSTNNFHHTTYSNAAHTVETGDVLEGEVLTRQRFPEYQSTQAFLYERTLEHARPVQGFSGLSSNAVSSVNRYLNHIRPETIDELTQGRSLDIQV
jgi:hypothetical protein